MPKSELESFSPSLSSHEEEKSSTAAEISRGSWEDSLMTQTSLNCSSKSFISTCPILLDIELSARHEPDAPKVTSPIDLSALTDAGEQREALWKSSPPSTTGDVTSIIEAFRPTVEQGLRELERLAKLESRSERYAKRMKEGNFGTFRERKELEQEFLDAFSRGGQSAVEELANVINEKLTKQGSEYSLKAAKFSKQAWLELGTGKNAVLDSKVYQRIDGELKLISKVGALENDLIPAHSGTHESPHKEYEKPEPIPEGLNNGDVAARANEEQPQNLFDKFEEKEGLQELIEKSHQIRALIEYLKRHRTMPEETSPRLQPYGDLNRPLWRKPQLKQTGHGEV